jgi:hypothetical protein
MRPRLVVIGMRQNVSAVPPSLRRLLSVLCASLLPVGLALGSLACVTARRPATEVTEPAPPAEPTPETSDEAGLVVKKANEDVIVAAWAEPKRLPQGGGQAHIIVRLQKRGGAPFPNVEVRLRASGGTLYSASELLITDNRGMTRDRLTARKTTLITLNAGGTLYRFSVPVGDEEEHP